MKKLVIAACCMLTALATFAQGTVNFNNNKAATGTGTIGALIFDVDGTTPLSGTGFQAALYGGAAGTAESALAFIGPAVGFRTGAAAGLVAVGTAGARVIPGVAEGAQATVQIRAWAGAAANFESATGAKGASALMTVTTGKPSDAPPGVPANLTGLQSFQLVVPEPSTIALGVLGAAALLIRRRK